MASGAVASGAYSAGSYAAGALAAGAFASGAGVDGWDLTQGAKADSVCGTATGTCSVISLLKFLNTAVGSAIPDCGANPCTNHIGLVDQGRAGSSAWPTAPSANATGGATTGGTASGIAANSNNSTNLKASAGTVYGVQTGNINASTAYWLKLYDKATAPTCGTDTPVKRILIPPNNSGNNVTLPVGVKFSNGIGFCIVTGIADNDNTSVPAATIAFNIDWN